MLNLPDITPDEYREKLDRMLDNTIQMLNQQKSENNPNAEQTQQWVELLRERKTYAPGLLHIIRINNGYILAYENRYVWKIIRKEYHFLFTTEQPSKDLIVHYLLQKQHWFNELQQIPEVKHIYDAIIAGIATPGTNDHVDYFRLRFDVLACQFLDVTTILPQGTTYNYNNSFIICYGKGTEPPAFNYQFEIYLVTLIKLLDPNVTDSGIIDILCNQLTNEISSADPSKPMKLDIHLIDKVKTIFNNDFRLVNERINHHLNKLRVLPNRAAGIELAGCTASMLKQIVDCDITALNAEELAPYVNFVSSDKK